MDHSPEEWQLIHRAKQGQTRMPCPWCSPHRKKKTETCLSVNRDGGTILYQCFHGDCGVTGRINSDKRGEYVKEEPVVVEKKRIEDFHSIDDRHIEWLSKRGISIATASAYNLVSDEVYGKTTIGFPYYDKDGNVVALKKRFLHEKEFRCWQSPFSFFGIRHIKKGDDLYIVEGEMDVLAMAEAGIKAVSIPNGSTKFKIKEGRFDPSDDGKLKFLWEAKEYIDAAKKIVIALDADEVGAAMAEEIARRIGKERCWRVTYPSGLKDANEVLVALGKESVKKAAEAATPWPIQGLYDAEHFRDKVWELYEKGAGRGESTGFESVDDIYTVAPGQVTIVTGIPSSGKSEFIDQVMVNLAEQKHWKFGICSFENEPRLHIAKLAAKRVGKPFFEGYHQRMDRHEYEAAFSFIQDHFAFVWQDDGSLADLDSILDRLRVAIMRYGIRGAIIDPYNFISRPRGESSETEWISSMLTKVKAFAMGHGVHIWFVAHPTKMQRNADGRIPVPGGFDISGSAAWFAKADCGLTVHREKEDPLLAQIHIWKCRFSWVGKQGQANLLYDVGTTRYSETEREPEGVFEI